jgi:energy-coupling factor transporter ATP-binding protein EcfA2
MDLAVETHGLTRRFGELTAVNGIDLAVPRGSLYGFLGPNGAGKSTTIKCLTSFLHRVELFRAALDPIFLLFAAAALALALGTLIAGRPLLALLAAVAGALLLVFFACFSALLSLGMQMLLRDGRRGELATLLLFLGLSAAGVVPQFFAHEHRTARARLLVTTAPAPLPRSGRPAPAGPEPALEIPAALRFLPSGLYAAGVSAAGAGRGAAMGLDLGFLALLAALGYAATATLHRRLLETPETAGPRDSRAPMRVRAVWFPGLSATAAATAAAQLLALLRTVRGKMLLLSPLFTTTLFAVAFTRGDGRHATFLAQPVAIAGIAVLIALANLASVTCNQLATDDSALVLEFLQPLEERDLLLGKLAGSTVLFAASVTIALLPLFVIFPGVSPALLLAVLLGGLATHFVLAPVNALLSAVFPKKVDLGKLGAAGKPHSAAALLAFGAQIVAVLPAAACILVAWRVVGRLALAPVFTGVLAIAAGGAAVAAMPLVARAVVARRENLVMVAAGR